MGSRESNYFNLYSPDYWWDWKSFLMFTGAWHFLFPLGIIFSEPMSIFIEEGNGNLLQYSSLENPMDRGPWRATFQGVSEGRSQRNIWAHMSIFICCSPFCWWFVEMLFLLYTLAISLLRIWENFPRKRVKVILVCGFSQCYFFPQLMFDSSVFLEFTDIILG